MSTYSILVLTDRFTLLFPVLDSDALNQSVLVTSFTALFTVAMLFFIVVEITGLLLTPCPLHNSNHANSLLTCYPVLECGIGCVIHRGIVSMPELSCWKKDMLTDPTAPEAVEQSWTECRNVASCRLPNTIGISVAALAYIFNCVFEFQQGKAVWGLVNWLCG